MVEFDLVIRHVRVADLTHMIVTSHDLQKYVARDVSALAARRNGFRGAA